MAQYVLDASAILAMVRAEVGWNRVVEALPGASLSSVNAAEVYAKLAEWQVSRAEHQKYHAVLQGLIVPFDMELALRAGALRPATRHLGLSLGNRACLALAQRLARPVLTADQAWAQLQVGIAIEVIR